MSDGRWLWDVIEASKHQVAPRRLDAFSKMTGRAMPRYPTGIPAWNNQTDGGGYGLTAIAGAPKSSKSHLANMIALESAKAGWHVVYVSTELSREEILQRACAYIAPELVDGPPQWFMQRWQALDYTDPEHPTHMATRLQGMLPEYDAERLLIVVDSVSRFAESLPDYYGALQELWGFLRRLVKLSEGAIGAVGIVEQNKAGGDKGGNAAYAANLLVRTAKNDEGLVEMSMPHSRATAVPKGGELGEYYLQYDRCRLVEYERVGETPIGRAGVDDEDPGEPI